MSAQRIVSLLPSATEIVATLGLAGRLVGRSHQCDYPPEVAALPALSSTKVRLDGDSRDIHLSVEEILTRAVSVYDVDAARLRALRPDVILTQTQCAICAVTPADLEDALCDWTGARPALISLEPDDLSEVWGDMLRVGEAVGASDRARAAVEDLQARLEAIRARAATAGRRPRVAAIEWIEPLMAGGNWMPELVRIAGGESLFAQPGVHSPWLAWETLVGADPEVIVILPCGFHLPQGLKDLALLRVRPEWRRLSAVRRGEVYVVDGQHFFNRPGPRLVESAEILAEILHPGLFDFGHAGRDWLRAA